MSNSKYDFEALVAKLNDADSVTMKFEELRELLGSWTDSAEKHQAWWSGKDRQHLQPLFAAGYKVRPDLKNKEVTFVKVSGTTVQSNNDCPKGTKTKNKWLVNKNQTKVQFETTAANGIQLSIEDEHGNKSVYTINFKADLILKRNPKNATSFLEYSYPNEAPFNDHGEGPFCDFSLENPPEEPGVYFWVTDHDVKENTGNIIYIGETDNLKRRFNTLYGHISPSNCHKHGGRSTNCKMNHIALKESQNGNTISIYFHKTVLLDRKKVEKELLSKIDTPYNVKDN